MTDPIRITDPPPAAKNVAGKPFNATVEHQMPAGTLDQGASTLQYSSHEEGPWVTAHPSVGPLTAPIVPYSRQSSVYVVSGVVQAMPLFVRAALWPDPGAVYQQPPTHAGEVSHWGVVASQQTEGVPARGERPGQ